MPTRTHPARRPLPRLAGAGLVTLALALGAGRGFASQDWPGWRGPDANGSTGTGRYPVSWSAESNLLWKVALPGKGCSTPAAWKGRIYVTAASGDQDAVLAFTPDGKTSWTTTLGPGVEGKHRNGSGSNPSPAADASGLYVYFKSGTLAALDPSGQVRWKLNVLKRYGKQNLYWDHGTSPVLTSRDVVLAIMHHGESYVAAFDKKSGELHWRAPRNYETPDEGDHSYATPLVLRRHGRESILVWGAEHLTAHDASTGAVLWSCAGFNPEARRNWVSVSSAVVAGDIAVVPHGRGTRLHGIRLGGRGDVTAANRVWLREDTGSFVPTPAARNGRIYLLRDRGELECLDARTGRTLFAGALPRSSASYYSSPTLAGDRLYAVREDGVIFTARVRNGFEVVGQSPMDERVIAAPVPLGDRLLIRGEKHLFCVRGE
jgi:hypothetical protein